MSQIHLICRFIVPFENMLNANKALMRVKEKKKPMPFSMNKTKLIIVKKKKKGRIL